MFNLSLAPRPVRLLQIQGNKSHTGLYRKGDLSITPAAAPFFARWDSDDRFLQMRITAQFMTQVAIEALAMNPDRLIDRHIPPPISTSTAGRTGEAVVTANWNQTRHR